MRYTIQVWSDLDKVYQDVNLKYDRNGWVLSYQLADRDIPATTFDDPNVALRDSIDLEPLTDSVTCVFDSVTGKHHFDENDFPE